MTDTRKLYCGCCEVFVDGDWPSHANTKEHKERAEPLLAILGLKA